MDKVGPIARSARDCAIVYSYIKELDDQPKLINFDSGFKNLKVGFLEDLFENDTSRLCSYIPVLYLDSLPGVIGGLYYGLRKEFHPEMKHNATQSSAFWYVNELISSQFVNT